jgi:hypothetical protein
MLGSGVQQQVGFYVDDDIRSALVNLQPHLHAATPPPPTPTPNHDALSSTYMLGAGVLQQQVGFQVDGGLSQALVNLQPHLLASPLPH